MTEAVITDNPTDTSNNFFIIISVMLATLMQSLDTTIANVALPHMQGALGATQDQISWVLTSYIVASAIFIPLTGYVSARFGRKKIILIAVAGFTVTSMLCGIAQNIAQIVLFRLLQGVFGACLIPLSQTIMMDTFPKERQGSAMAIWGIGIMVGPILGPSLGGWLTEYYSWRWVFYINIPFGILAWFGILTYIKETAIDKNRIFDLFGFILLSLSIGSLQMLLDRGELLDWFASPEIILEAILSFGCFYLFIAHMFTCKKPFIDPKIFADKNFSVGLVFIFIIGIILLATMALLPPFMQNLMGYPVLDVGYLLAPRGFGTMVAMMILGKLSGKVDVRYVIAIGLFLTFLSLWEMTQFTTDITGGVIVKTGIIQGFGLGLIFMPLSNSSFSTLSPHHRSDGTALFNLIRNLGSSIGISLVISELSRNIQTNHAAFSVYINPYSYPVQFAQHQGSLNLLSQQGLVAINNEVTRQASILAYLQDFRLMMWVTLLAAPLILLLRSGK